MKLSVIVTTAPNREDNLNHCLDMLTQQTDPDFDVVVVDDGSLGANLVVDSFRSKLQIQHIWRTNDFCLSRSRNRGVKAALGDYLVIIDGDVLLNPQAVERYKTYFGEYPKSVILGYFGTDAYHQAPSAWLPDRQVNYLDKRIEEYRRNKLVFRTECQKHPHWFYWGGNTGISRTVYDSIGGSDERYRGWGSEDLQFALDLTAKGCPFIYAPDIWTEHQVHPRSSNFYQAKKRKVLNKHIFEGISFKQPQIMWDNTLLIQMLKQLFQNYYPQDKTVPDYLRTYISDQDSVIYSNWIDHNLIKEQFL